MPDVAVSHADLLKGNQQDGHVLADSLGLLGSGSLRRFAVIGGRAIAAMERAAATSASLDAPPEWQPCRDEGPAFDAARKLAQSAAATTGLGLASVDTVTSRQGPIIVEITTNLSIAQFERICGATLADAIIVLLEKEARAKAIRIAAAQQ